MNNLKVSMNTLKGLSLCSALCLAVAAGQSQAQQMTDGNSVVTLDPTHGGGLNGWTVDTQNQLAQQWFWYRLDGSGAPDQAINTLSSKPTITQPTPGMLNVTYQGSQLRVEVDYWLSGGNLGDGSASLNEIIKIRNVSAAALSGHFIQYSDFDLASSASGDSVTMNLDKGSGLFSGATQTKGGLNLLSSITAQSDAIPFAVGGEAGLYSSTLGNLASAYDLNGNLTAGPGDATWALEWNFNLNPNQSFTVNKSEYISGVSVPEPSSLAMLAAGLAWVITAAGRRSRHNG